MNLAGSYVPIVTSQRGVWAHIFSPEWSKRQKLSQEVPAVSAAAAAAAVAAQFRGPVLLQQAGGVLKNSHSRESFIL